MAKNPYAGRIARGAGAGALSGAAAGSMIVPGPIGMAGGAVLGGLTGALLARPGEDERQYRARLARLNRGVLGEEERDIMNTFVDPVRSSVQEADIRSRAIQSPAASTGGQARQQIINREQALDNIRKAAAQGALSVRSINEQRKREARQGYAQLAAQDRRDKEAMRALAAQGAMDLAQMKAEERALERILGEQEAARLAQNTAKQNQADIDAMDQAVADAFFGVSPDAADQTVMDAYFGVSPDAAGVPAGAGGLTIDPGQTPQARELESRMGSLLSLGREVPSMEAESTVGTPVTGSPVSTTTAPLPPVGTIGVRGADLEGAEALANLDAGFLRYDLIRQRYPYDVLPESSGSQLRKELNEMTPEEFEVYLSDLDQIVNLGGGVLSRVGG